MKWARWLRKALLVFGGVLGCAACATGLLWIYLNPAVERVNGIAYSQRDGRPLVLDIVRPLKSNGFGVLMIVSGGWKSGGAGSFRPWIVAPLLRSGYTIFPIYHLSQPQATIMSIVEDVHRAVRLVRHHAPQYHVDPRSLGVIGGSAGGHLSLMLATAAQPGRSDALDAVDRESSQVQAVGVFYPPTDLLNLGTSTENPGDGGPPKSFAKAFGEASTNLVLWKVVGRDLSPIYHLGSNLPPTLIFHGDADTLVPLDQSQRFQAEAQKWGNVVELIVHRGGQHGWLTMVWDIRRFVDWFNRYLQGPVVGSPAA